MTAPASPVEPPMDPEFVRLVEDYGASYKFCNRRTQEEARRALHRWHREQVERAVREAVAPLLAAINWACGAGDSDFSPPIGLGGAGRYWWRWPLIEKAGLVYNPATSHYETATPPAEARPDDQA